MNAQPHHDKLNPDEELTRVLNRADAARQPVILETPGARYRVVREGDEPNVTEDPWAHYDPEKARAALHASAGMLKGIDVEEFPAELREQRGQDSTGRPA